MNIFLEYEVKGDGDWRIGEGVRMGVVWGVVEEVWNGLVGEFVREMWDIGEMRGL